jgi:hypothetical protein
VIGVRNKLLGLSWNLWAGPMGQVNTVYWLHAAFPDLARRTWWLLRRKDLRLTPDGRAALAPLLSSRLDPGNYRLGTDTFAMVATLMAAREVGDDEYASAAYPAVLVARAVTDGRALDLVLHPGAGPVRTTLAVERPVPHRAYSVRGGCTDTVTADGAGRALVEVELTGRHELRLS